ncbi:MATE family efflux transporter [Treponema vincentii]|uniref:MATE family efflux transporter n=1 Tax=Treponema vincentii TaxID=69710 RepID=UPI003D8A2BFA
MIAGQRNSDLTEGIIWKTLIIFTVPILVGNFFQHLYTTADAVIIGRFTGKEGLAAIDSIFSLLRLPVNLFSGLSAGSSILISQLYGAKKYHDLSKTMHTALVLTFIVGTFLSVIGVLSAPALLVMMGVPSDIFNATLIYARIYFGGMLISLFYNIAAGILRAMGNAQTPFYALVVSSGINVILDIVFIGVFKWGIGGAAFATVLAQLCSASILFVTLSKKSSLCPLHISQLKLYGSAAVAITKLGIPIGLQSILFPIANMIIQARINGTGTEHIAAWALCGKLDFLIWISIEAMTTAVSTFVAQNYGAKKYDRVNTGIRTGLLIGVTVIGILSAILYFWCVPLGKLFIGAEDYGVLTTMERLMHLIAPFYTVFVFSEILSAAMYGIGETFKPMIITLLGICVFRILWIWCVVPLYPSIEVIVWAFPASWSLTTVAFIVAYLRLRRNI